MKLQTVMDTISRSYGQIHTDSHGQDNKYECKDGKGKPKNIPTLAVFLG